MAMLNMEVLARKSLERRCDMRVHLMDQLARPTRIGGQTIVVTQQALFILWLFLAVGLLYGCSTTLELTSLWRDREIAIDGVDSEWRDATTYARASDAALGITNDANYLYACLITSNRQVQVQMLAYGCTVWLDPEGKANKTFGIHFPVGGQLQARRFLTRDNPEELQRFVDLAQSNLEIVGLSEADRRQIVNRNVTGIDARLGYSEGILVYELKVPLRETAEHRYAIGATGAQTISVGFETGEIGPSSQPRASDQAMGSSSRVRSRGRSTSSSQGARDERVEPLQLWATVRLASGATAITK
jgi:hypothetical protein